MPRGAYTAGSSASYDVRTLRLPTRSRGCSRRGPTTGERNPDERSDCAATGNGNFADRTRWLRGNRSCVWHWRWGCAYSSHERADHIDINTTCGADGSCSDDCSVRATGRGVRGLTEATTGDAADFRNIRHHAAVSPRGRWHNYGSEFITWRALSRNGDWAGGRVRAHDPRPCWNLRIGEHEQAPCSPRHRDCGQPRSDRLRHNGAIGRLRCRTHRDRIRQRAAPPHHRLRRALTPAVSPRLCAEAAMCGGPTATVRRSAQTWRDVRSGNECQCAASWSSTRS